MALEVSCGQCHGRLLVETLGVVVACPHCGTHLSIPAPAAEFPAPISDPPPPISDPPPQPPSPIPDPLAVATCASPTEVLNPDGPGETERVNEFAVASLPPTDVIPSDDSAIEGPDEPTGNAQVGWHSAPKIHLSAEAGPFPAEAAVDFQPPPPVTEPAPEPATFVPVLDAAPTPVGPDLHLSASQMFTLSAPPNNVPHHAEPPPAATPSPPLTFGAAPTATTPLVFGAASAPASFPTFGGPAVSAPSSSAPMELPTFGAAPAVSTVTDAAAGHADSEFASRQKFQTMMLIIVGSYASAVTIFLVYQLVFGRSSALESLPDLKPPVGKNGEFSWRYNPPKNSVAPGHVMALGESRRFGNVKVTPLKVTRGVVNFEHFTGQSGFDRVPSDKLLKLWVKFENVSGDQTFAPLDAYLLFTRDEKNLGESVRANSFVAVDADRKLGNSLFYHYDKMSVTSEFRMVGQNLDKELAPGESLETFVPSEEAASKLDGELVWRFQFRKGYNRRSHRGVTTLIDVRFTGKDIKDERA